MMGNLLITGLGRHGKDTACEYLRDKYGIAFANSSYTAAELFIFDALKDSHGYETVKDCFDDRHTDANRKIWYDMICEYNKDDKARLAKDILSNNDIYCGMRSIDELTECRRQGVIKFSIWIDAKDRLGLTEDSSSITITEQDCNMTIRNNGLEADFYRSLDLIYRSVIAKM